MVRIRPRSNKLLTKPVHQDRECSQLKTRRTRHHNGVLGFGGLWNHTLAVLLDHVQNEQAEPLMPSIPSLDHFSSPSGVCIYLGKAKRKAMKRFNQTKEGVYKVQTRRIGKRSSRKDEEECRKEVAKVAGPGHLSPAPVFAVARLGWCSSLSTDA